MADDSSFRELLQRVRAGEETAAAELVQRYEGALRRTVRVRLRDTRLRRYLDSMDICQSVLASFFVRAALGQYSLDTPEELLQLLAVMARNKVINQAKHGQARRRDYRRLRGGDALEGQIARAEATPSQLAAGKELLQEAQNRLTAEERQLLDLRRQGRDWPYIAGQLKSTPEAVRKRLERALDRVAAELELDV